MKWKRVPGAGGDWVVTQFKLPGGEYAKALIRFNKFVDDSLYPPFVLEIYNITTHSDTQLLCIEFWAGPERIIDSRVMSKPTTWDIKTAQRLVPDIFKYVDSFAVKMNKLDKLRKL